MTTAHAFDRQDAALVAALQRDARAPLNDVARGAQLGSSAARVRINRLERAGVLAEYRAIVPAQMVGYALHAVVRMKVHGALFDQVRTVIESEPQIVRCLRITGETCYHIELVATGMPDLERLTSRLARVGSITTDLVYNVVADRPTPVERMTAEI